MDTPSTTTTAVDQESRPRPPGRPRSERAEQAIVEATLDLLPEAGVAGLSLEQVAARAGVGKATIYRRWPNKEALVVDSLASLSEQLPPLPGRSVREDLVLVVESIRRRSENSHSGRLFPCMLAEGARHPELKRRYLETVVEPRREVVREVLRRGIANGELRADLDVELALGLVTAPMLLRVTVLAAEGTGPVPGDLPERLVDLVLEGLARG